MSRLGLLVLSSSLAVTGTLWYGWSSCAQGTPGVTLVGCALATARQPPSLRAPAHGAANALALFAGGAALSAASFLLLGTLRDRRHTRPEAALEPGQQEYTERALAQHANELITVHDQDGAIHYASFSAQALTGYSSVELLGRRSREFVHRDDWPMLLALLRAVMTGSAAPAACYRIRTAEGAWLWMEAEFRRHVDRAGALRIIAVARAAGRPGSSDNPGGAGSGPEAGASDPSHRVAPANTHDMVTLHVADGSVVQASPSAVQLTGYPVAELLGRRLSALWHPEDAGYARATGAGGFAGFVPRATVRLRRRDGEYRWLDYAAEAGSRSDTFMVSWRDVTALMTDGGVRRAAHSRLRAHHDASSGLLNREGFTASVRAALLQADCAEAPLSVCLVRALRLRLDDDGSCARHPDDALQRALATRIRTHAHAALALAHLGSGTFAMLLGHGDARELAELAQRLTASFMQPVPLADGLVQLSATVGSARYPHDAITAQGLLEAAEDARQAADGQGGDPSYRHAAPPAGRLAPESSALQDLQHAYLHGEFALHYQLKVRLASWEVTGCEALLRWHTPGGVRTAAPLVAAAERSGFMARLGEWVVREAARQSLAWRGEGLAIPIAINISAQQLYEASFVPLMRELAQADPQLARHLQLELTESALALDLEQAREALAQLAAMGFALHLDDFGTGYLSLAQLSRLPVHALKIDRSLVRELPGSAQSCELAHAVIALGNALNLKVVAEGVETAGQLKFLRTSRCDEAQGFLFCRPISAAALAPLWRGGVPAS